MLHPKAMKKYRKPPVWRGIIYYLRCVIRRRPNWVNIEVTKRCNARCDFCGYWDEKGSPELDDYSPIVKAFRPVVLSLSGGEPLIRRNLHEIIRKLRPYCHYVGLVTNGTLLNEERARELFDAGVNQLSVSLDYVDDRHDKARGVPGLCDKIKAVAPALAEKGYNIAINTVMMDSNLDQIIPLAEMTSAWGVGHSFSTYCSFKRNNHRHSITVDKSHELAVVLKELKRIKRRTRLIKNSDYYLDMVPQYVTRGGIPNCKAGVRWIQVAPDGYLQPCSDLPRYCHFTEYSRKDVPPISCTKCWYACRGEAEANLLHPRRVVELARS